MKQLDSSQSIAVIGAGAMGSGIAQVAAQAGHHVILFDTNAAALERSRDQLSKVAQRLVNKERWTQEQSDAIQQRIQRTESMEEVKPCALIIEAIIEDFNAKKSLLQRIEAMVTADTIIATNTSSLSVTALAGQLERPEQCIGLHFFNPAPLMALVEVVPALQTDPKIGHSCHKLMEDWGKSPVIAKDTPGFIVNRVARPFYGEALRIAEEGTHDFEFIDEAMRAVGFRMGPFELMDLIGNDINYAVTSTVFEAFYHDSRYRPNLIQKSHIDAGWLGKKVKRGYFAYDNNGNKSIEQISSNNAKLTDEHGVVSNRIIAMLINEAVDALRLKIASEADLETAMTKGVNYPIGLLKWGNDWGLNHVLEQLETLQNHYGEERYRPSPLLKKMVQSGQKFRA
jgi:3-hydroxybutyryl-CoA dehydrogenase